MRKPDCTARVAARSACRQASMFRGVSGGAASVRGTRACVEAGKYGSRTYTHSTNGKQDLKGKRETLYTVSNSMLNHGPLQRAKVAGG